MEKNLSYPKERIHRIHTKLTWAQVEVVTGNTDDIKLMVAGDEESVEELRAEYAGEELIVSQPQLAYAKEILPRRRWLQIFLSIPSEWKDDIDIDSISGMVGVHKINGKSITLTTVSGSILAEGITSDLLCLHTVSGGITGSTIHAQRGHFRTISGGISLTDVALHRAKAFTLSGNISLSLRKGGHTLDMQSVSGSLLIDVEEAVNVTMRSLGGRYLIGEEVEQSKKGLDITVSSVAGDLTIKGRK